MSRFEFNLATQEDDHALRELLASMPMQGNIELAFAREPSYFGASGVDGEFVQIVAARDTISKQIIGMGSRAISGCYVNGQVTEIGYLSGLRLLPEYRGKAAILARGYRFFRELHEDRRARFYLTTIAADNERAIEVLASQRAGLPVYLPVGRYYTLTISPRRPHSLLNTITIRKANSDDGPRIIEFLNEQGPTRQFFPAYDRCEFFDAPRRLIGLKNDSILLAEVDGRLVGTLGLWDQSKFKQSLVCGYSKHVRMGRPFYNGYAAIFGKPMLPKVGESLNFRYAAIPVIANSDPHIAESLISSACNILREQSVNFLAAGFHERDPLLPIFRRYSGLEYVTLVYLVHWPDECPEIEKITNRVPYLELGCL